jgi:hypothetical protein
VDLAEREERLLSRFTSAHPAVAVTRVPVVANDIADLDGLREIGSRLAAGDSEEPAAAAPGRALRSAR